MTICAYNFNQNLTRKHKLQKHTLLTTVKCHKIFVVLIFKGNKEFPESFINKHTKQMTTSLITHLLIKVKAETA